MLLFSLIFCILATTAESGVEERSHLKADHESARKNAHLVFNVIHSAGRQWGSSLNHNGFSFFPAVVPKGTLLYHGTHYEKPPSTFEWLAFEVEHSEVFAASFRIDEPPRHPRNGQRPRNGLQKPLGQNPGDKEPGNIRGYLQTYRANRDLKILYLDGSSAGKTTMGTLDSQDLVLLENPSAGNGHHLNEIERAGGLCDLVTQWGYDGVMRMEIGFEIIYCDFNNGINMTSATRTYLEEDKLKRDDVRLFQWARAAGERYDGLKGDRVRIDFSSMSSGLFFPINISSTDRHRPDLIRLGAASLGDLKSVKDHVERLANQPRRFTVDWQAVVDMVVTRFSTGLVLMGWDDISTDNFIKELERAVLTFVDAPRLPEDIDLGQNSVKNATLESIDRCTKHYLLPALLVQDDWSFEDKLIHTAIKTVLEEICNAFFAMRSMLLEASPDKSTAGYLINADAQNEELQHAVQVSRAMTKDLMKRLAWTDWKRTRPCQPDEIMFVAMWPFGSEEDHWEPGCRSIKQMGQSRRGYWDFNVNIRSPPNPGQ